MERILSSAFGRRMLWLGLVLASLGGCGVVGPRATEVVEKTGTRQNGESIQIEGDNVQECIHKVQDRFPNTNIVLLATSLPATPISAEAGELWELLQRVAGQAGLGLRRDPEAFVLFRLGVRRQGSFQTANQAVKEWLMGEDKRVYLDLRGEEAILAFSMLRSMANLSFVMSREFLEGEPPGEVHLRVRNMPAYWVLDYLSAILGCDIRANDDFLIYVYPGGGGKWEWFHRTRAK